MFQDNQPNFGSPDKSKGGESSQKLLEKKSMNNAMSPSSNNVISKSVNNIKSTPDSHQREVKQEPLVSSVNLKRGFTQKQDSEPQKLLKKPEPAKKKHHTPAQSKKEENNNDGMFDNMDPDKLDWRQMFL